jgi:hypothetical protein
MNTINTSCLCHESVFFEYVEVCDDAVRTSFKIQQSQANTDIKY